MCSVPFKTFQEMVKRTLSQAFPALQFAVDYFNIFSVIFQNISHLAEKVWSEFSEHPVCMYSI